MQNSPKWLFAESQNTIDRNRLVAMINSLHHAFLAVSEDGSIEFSNSFALHLLDANQLQGKNISDAVVLYNQANQTVNIFQLLRSQNNNFTTSEYGLKHSDGRLRRVRISAAPLRPADKTQKDGFTVLISELDNATSS